MERKIAVRVEHQPRRQAGGGTDKSLASNQALEDTLWIGAAVIQVVSESMRAMEGTLRLEAQRNCIGTVFEENLKKAEDAVREVRRVYMAISDADNPEFERNSTN